MSNTEYIAHDKARLRPVGSMPGVEVLDATFLNHRFSPHMHDTWCVSAVLSGMKDDEISASSNVIRSGEISVLLPGEIHAGRSLGQEPCRYVMIYVPPELMTKCLPREFSCVPSFARAAIRDDDIFHRVENFVNAVLNNSNSRLVGHYKEDLSALLSHLVMRHGMGRARDEPPTRPHVPRICRARDFLHVHWDKPITLGELAAFVSLSPHHLCRQFAEIYGLPPHRYQLGLRLARAKAMIIAGEGLADVAVRTGFADQSHLGRHFRTCFGITPGSVAASYHEARYGTARSF